jgi:hypothetical protein
MALLTSVMMAVMYQYVLLIRANELPLNEKTTINGLGALPESEVK